MPFATAARFAVTNESGEPANLYFYSEPHQPFPALPALDERLPRA